VAGGRSKLTRLRQQATYLAFRMASQIAPHVPRALAYRISDVAGDLFWVLNGPARRAVRANLRHVLGRAPEPGLIRQAFRHGARNYYDTLIIPTLGPERLLSLVPVRGWEHLDQALGEGRGVIIVGVHLSSVALAGQVIAARGHAVTSIAERVEPPGLMQLLTRLRSGGGVRVLPQGSDTIRELLAALRRNEIVGLVADRDITGTGVTARFFDAETQLPAGGALLAIRTGAPLLSAVAVRTADDRFEALIDPPIEVERGADRSETVRQTTRRVAERFERHIASHPEQWTVYQPVWPRSDRRTGRTDSR